MNKVATMALLAGLAASTKAMRGPDLSTGPTPYQRKPLSNRERKQQEKNARKRAKENGNG